MRAASDSYVKTTQRLSLSQTWATGTVFLIVLGLCASVSAAPRMALVVRGAGAGSDKAAAFVGHYFKAELENDSRYDLVNFDVVLGNPAFERAEEATGGPCDGFW